MTIQQARRFAGQSLGLPSTFDGTFAAMAALSPANQVALNRAVLNYIIANPANFTPEQVATARAQPNHAGAAALVVDDSFSWGEFTGEVVSNANDLIGAPLVGIGNAAGLVFSLLPLALIIGAGLFAYSLSKKIKA